MKAKFALALLATPLVLARATPRPFTLRSAIADVPDLTCSSTDRWPVGLGEAYITQEPDDELREILAEVDPARIEAIIEKLVSFGTRHTMSSQDDPKRGIGAARDWIAAEMRSFAEASEGRMTVETPSFIQPPNGDRIDRDTNITNIVAILRGDTDPERAYLVSGHYDSRNSDPMDFEGDAPGADDDASGVALSMELARVMSTRRTAATLMFVAVAGEEQGLLGATNLADQLTSENSTYDLQGMFTNDIIGSPKADDGTVDPYSIRLFGQGVNPNDTETAQASRLILGGENDTPPRQLARFVREVASNDATNMTVNVIYRIDRFLRGGDHRPFLERGIAAARFTEPHENYAHQHQDVRLEDGQQYGDLLEFCDFDFISRVARVSGAALWSLANAPGTPKNVTIDASVLGNNSTLGWTLDDAAESYEVVWRATNAPFWSNVIDVGKTDTTTIRQSKDNAVFGVRAVGANGYRSPAEYPRAINCNRYC